MVLLAPLLGGCDLLSEQPDTSIPVRYGPVTERRIDIVPKPKPPVPEKHVAISSLVGSTMAEIEASLGRPKTVREEKPAVVYEYRAEGCEMKLIFFMDIERDEFRVLSYDVKAAQQRFDDLQRCVDGIAAAKVPS